MSRTVALVLVIMITFTGFSQDRKLTDEGVKTSNDIAEPIEVDPKNRYYTEEEYRQVVLEERQSFEKFGMPDKNSPLSTFLAAHVTEEDLEKIDFSTNKTSYETNVDPFKSNYYENAIRLSFHIDDQDQIQHVHVNTGDEPLDKKLKDLFHQMPISQLNLSSKNKTGKNSVQLFVKEDGKAIIKASTHVVFDELPNFEDCPATQRQIKRSRCIHSLISLYFHNNISRKTLVKLDAGGYVLQFRFTIDADGEISNINSSSSSRDLRKEMDRLIKKMDFKITPAKRNGVPVSYYLNMETYFTYGGTTYFSYRYE